MTHFLFPTLGSSGDVLPLITLARAMLKRGHACSIIANPVFKNIVQTGGIDFIELGTTLQYQELTQDPALFQPTRAFSVIAKKGILPLLEPLYQIFTGFSPVDSIIVSPLLLFASHIAHKKLGFRFVTLPLQPSLLRSRFSPPALGTVRFPKGTPPGLVSGYYALLDSLLIDPLLMPELNAFRSSLGLPSIRRIFQNHLFSPQKNICIFPGWFSSPQPDWPANTICTGFLPNPPTTFQLSDEVESFLNAGEAPLIFTAGSAMKFGAAFFETAVSSCISMGKRAILLSQDHSQIPLALPKTILHQRYIPLNLILPYAEAFVHPGGIGSLAQALAAGIPQLIMPMSQDQPDNAERIQRFGLGDALFPNQFKRRHLVPELEKLLSNQVIRSNCKDCASKINFAQALQDTVDQLETMIT